MQNKETRSRIIPLSVDELLRTLANPSSTDRLRAQTLNKLKKALLKANPSAEPTVEEFLVLLEEMLKAGTKYSQLVVFSKWWLSDDFHFIKQVRKDVYKHHERRDESKVKARGLSKENQDEASSESLRNCNSNYLYRVWYCTDRKSVNSANEKAGYSSARVARGSPLHFGACDVIIPRSHKFGSLGSSWVTRWLSQSDDRLRVKLIDPMQETAFLKLLSKEIESLENPNKQALIYLHGYNVNFEEAAIRAAQIGFDLKFPGVTAFFSWASRGRTASYSMDEASIEVIEPALIQFLTCFVRNLGLDKVHILAHSMGNRALLRAMDAIHKASEMESALKFGQIFLAAPDVDVDHFQNLAKVYCQISTRTTLYASPRDRAVLVSRLLHGAPRAGFIPPVTIVPGVDTVIVPGFDLDVLGHSYFAEAEGVLGDIFDLLRRDVDPVNRQRLYAVGSKKERYYLMRPSQ